MSNEDDEFYMNKPQHTVGLLASGVLNNAQYHRATLGLSIVDWPEDHPRGKLGQRWILIVREEPSLTETPDNFEQVPLLVNEEEEDKRAVEWMKKYGYSDEEIAELWMTVPRQWVPALQYYPLVYYD